MYLNRHYVHLKRPTGDWRHLMKSANSTKPVVLAFRWAGNLGLSNPPGKLNIGVFESRYGF